MGAKQIPSRKHKKGKKPWEFPDYQRKQRRWGGKYFRQNKPVAMPLEWDIEPPALPATVQVKQYADYVTYEFFKYPSLVPVPIPEEGVQQLIQFNTFDPFTVDLSDIELKVISQVSKQMAEQAAKAVNEQMMQLMGE